MFKKPTKKQSLIRRIIFSTVATIAVLIIVTVSILFMLGYRLDSDSRRLEQGALLQLNSTPEGAQIWIDDKYIGSQTSAKQTVLAGVHKVTLKRDKYEDWNRTLQLDAGTLTWLSYPRLVPIDRPVQSVATYETLSAMRFSPDLKWALGHEKADSPVFNLIDLRSTEIKSSTLTLNPELYSEATTTDVPHRFDIDRWSSGARYAIIKHTYADAKVEWLLVDTQDISKSINITRSLSVELSSVRFTSNSGISLYGLTTDGVVRKLDLSGGTISRGLITHVKEFSVFEENSVVSYIGTDPTNAEKTVVGIYKDGDSASRVLRSADGANADLKIAITRYFGDDYVAISEGASVDVLMGSLPSATQETSSLRQFAHLETETNITTLSFGPGGEYLLAQSGSNFSSYELEHMRAAKSSIAVADGQTASQLKWLDGAHFWNDDNGSLVMRDFNGINTHTIMKVESGFGASLSQNGRFFYGVGKTEDGKYQLQRVRMILE